MHCSSPSVIAFAGIMIGDLIRSIKKRSDNPLTYTKRQMYQSVLFLCHRTNSLL